MCHIIKFDEHTAISLEEIKFVASRSSGPGGQHVNKTSTKVTLLFDVKKSAGLTEEQKLKVLTRMSSRINGEGMLYIRSQRYKSQFANKTDALEIFSALVKSALEEKRIRKITRLSIKRKKERIEAKRKKSRLKETRKKVDW